MIRMIVRGDNATTIDAIVTEAVVVVEAARVVAMSISQETQVRPVSPVVSLTDVNSTYRQCLASMRNSTTYFHALTLFDTV